MGMGAGIICWVRLSALAATAVKDYLAAHGIKGRVRYYGCPAEEGGAAKGFMARAGAFSDVDVAISWHPAAFSGVTEAMSLANTRIDFTFHGRASHAAAAPHLGRSALDAVELMNVGVNYMREHMPSDARIHYAVLDAAGSRRTCAGAGEGPLPDPGAGTAGADPADRAGAQGCRGSGADERTRVESEVVSAVSNLLRTRRWRRRCTTTCNGLGRRRSICGPRCRGEVPGDAER